MLYELIKLSVERMGKLERDRLAIKFLRERKQKAEKKGGR